MEAPGSVSGHTEQLLTVRTEAELGHSELVTWDQAQLRPGVTAPENHSAGLCISALA